MKYVITFVLSSGSLITAIRLSGHPMDGSSVLAILVVSCLAVWMVQEYTNEPRTAIVPRRAPESQPAPIARMKPARKPFRAPALEMETAHSNIFVRPYSSDSSATGSAEEISSPSTAASV